MAEPRNPLVDPKPGDWIAGTGPKGPQEIRIDWIGKDEVYMVRFRDREQEGVAFRMAIESYREQAVTGRVVWRTEDGLRPVCS
jgi:hypothetical protein